MARFTGAIYGLLVLALSQYAAAQTVHVVGDGMGWAVPQGGANAYVTWANGRTFSVGDILTFNYGTNEHDVLRVPRESFDSCSSSNGIGDVITTGPVNITLDVAGEHYYICTIGRHCAAGQKLAITVSGTPEASPPSATPTPAAPTTPSTPSPALSNTPADCAPTPTPAGPTTPGSQVPTTSSPPLPGSSSSKALASVLFSLGAIMMALYLF